ncbi:MAG: glycosyltransferase family 39 protein [Caldilineaceae bacterium]
MAPQNQRFDPRHFLAILGILLVAIGLRFWRLDTLPPGFHFDESFEGLEALHMLQDPSYRPIFLTGNFGVPPLNSYLNALTFGLFLAVGAMPGPLAMHVTAATAGSLTILAIYALGWELYRLAPGLLSPSFPLWSAAALAVMRWHIHFSRMGIEPVLVPLIWCAACWLFLRGWRTGHWRNFAASGAMLAAGMYTYQGAWVIPFLFIPLTLHLIGHGWRTARRSMTRTGLLSPVSTFWQDRPRRWGVGITILAAVALTAPLGWFFYQNPVILLMRPTQLAIVGETGSPADASFWHNVWATVRMFGPLGALGDLDPRRNVPGLAALNVWLAIPFYVGALFALWRAWQPTFGLLLVGLAGLVAPGIFSEYAPHFHRILGAAAPTALLCGVGLDVISRMRIPQIRAVPRLAGWVCVGLVVLGGVTSGWNYFKRWGELPDLFYAFDVGFWELGQWIAAQPADATIYITPRGADHPTIQFALQSANPQVARKMVSFDGRHVFPYGEAPQSVENYVSIEHEDFRTRLLLPGIFPKATIAYSVVDGVGQTYANVYTRQPEEAAQRLPQHSLNAPLGDGIRLIGYDVQPEELVAGQVLYLQLYWQTVQSPQADWTVFAHLLAAQSDGQFKQVAGHDSPPGAGTLPTTQWAAGWRILDEVQILLPTDLAEGEYLLRAGMYQQVNGDFVPLGETVDLDMVRIDAP